MPRRRRLAVAGYPHHIVQRGHNRAPVFLTRWDRHAYLRNLRESVLALGVQVHAYCLMTNHVHLVVNPGDDGTRLSLLMQRLAGEHTRRINLRESRTGTAWEGRFKCSPIELDRYLLACCRYVELNPVRAGMVARPEQYRWSSYRCKIGLEACDWLTLDPAFLGLASTLDAQRRCYRELVEQGVAAQELQLIRGALRCNALTGSEQFAKEVERRTGQRVARRSRGRPKKGTDPIFS